MTQSTLAVSLTVILGACSSPEPAPTTETPAVAGEADTPTDTAPPRPGGSAPPAAGVAAATHGDAHAGENEADQTVRLAFEPGTSQATVQDTLGRAALHDYRVEAAAGQTLTATLRSGGPPTVLVMDDAGYSRTAVRPLGWTVNEAVTDPAGWRWQGTLPHDGVYWVRVAHSGPAVNGGAWSPYALTVEVR